MASASVSADATRKSAEPPVSSGGEINVFYTGLPSYHPVTIEKGWDPVAVDSRIHEEVKALLKAGYNVYVLFAGPEIPIKEIGDKMNNIGVRWHATGIGMGVRAATHTEVIHLFEDLITLFREVAPEAQQIFNNGPQTTASSIHYRFPSADTSKPGKLLGFDCLFDGNKGEPFVPDQ